MEGHYFDIISAKHEQVGSFNTFLCFFSARGGLDGGWGIFEGGGNARIVICHFMYHTHVLRGKREVGSEVGEGRCDERRLKSMQGSFVEKGASI